MRIDAAAWDGGHASFYSELVRSLEPYAGLLIDADIPKWHTIGIPLVSLSLMDQARGALSELVVDTLFPEVGGFDNMRIRRDEHIG
jgi:hypothetical protein